MSKELTLNQIISKLKHDKKYDEKIILKIETTFKDYKRLKSLKLLPYPQENGKEYRQDVVKRLSVLEIIKTKRVDVDLFYTIMEDEHQFDKLQAYNFWQMCNKTKLTKEEFDLLKEVLLWNLK